MSDEDSVREAIATNNNRIAQERAFTVERIDRLRRFAREDMFKQHEREEWNHFHDRVYFLERETEAMIQTLATALSYQSPAPVFVPREDKP